uniref:NADH-ubiquinone oxidoreductase chain 6 n=1 Tax=Argulus japonicus TaxID=873553 RepID=A0A7I8F017_9CRUS|nr:NADH dehydrogenase subunit 6 [Argulus japonicus]
MLTMSMIFTTSLFLSLNHPLLMSITVILSSLNACFLLKSHTPSWLIMILFILYLGGMMVIFLYMCSLSYNMKISVNKKTLISSFLFSIVMLIMLMSNNSSINNKSFVPSILYSSPNSLMIIVLTTYLLIILMIMSSITTKKEGALKSI